MNIGLTIKNGIAHVLLDNSPYNLISNAIKREIKETFQSLSTNENVRVILFETLGKHFCCGADLKEFSSRIQNDMAKDAWVEGHAMLQAIMDTPQPTVVCVKGNALGGGAELASAFDIRIFADNVSFGYPEVYRSVFPGNGGFERFIQIAGEANAAYLFLTGNKIDAAESLRIGIANRVIVSADLEEEGLKTANLLASHSNVTVKTIKQAICSYRNSSSFFQQGMKYFDSLHKTEDIMESINAFFEKRQPKYQHR
jgi:enoyl-CoA hydratase